jgi:hypothetical protein
MIFKIRNKDLNNLNNISEEEESLELLNSSEVKLLNLFTQEKPILNNNLNSSETTASDKEGKEIPIEDPIFDLTHLTRLKEDFELQIHNLVNKTKCLRKEYKEILAYLSEYYSLNNPEIEYLYKEIALISNITKLNVLNSDNNNTQCYLANKHKNKITYLEINPESEAHTRAVIFWESMLDLFG